MAASMAKTFGQFLTCFSGQMWGVTSRRAFHSGRNVCGSVKDCMKGRKHSSQLWLKRQMKDPYVKKARFQSYRCRSAFKLLELDTKFDILKQGDVVIDCGAAPGSWTQVAVEKTKQVEGSSPTTREGMVVAVDILGFPPVEGAIILPNMDFTHNDTQKKILHLLNGRKANVILSDMAPNASGHKSMDHENIIELCRCSLNFSKSVLRPGGTFLCKIWQGGLQQDFMKQLKEHFDSVKVVKPDASRMDSAETFLLSRKFSDKVTKKISD